MTRDVTPGRSTGMASSVGMAVALCWAATCAGADDARPCAPPPCESPRCEVAACCRGNPRWTITGTGTWNATADLENDRGDLTTRRVSMSVDAEYEVSPGLSYALGVGFDESSYDFSTPDAIVAGAGRLFDEGYEVRVAPGFAWEVNDDWKLAATATLRSGLAPGADVAESLTGSIYATARRRVGSMYVTVGAYAETTLEADPFVLPIVLLDSTTTGAIRMELRGSGVRAAYDLRHDLTIAATVRYDRRDFRMAADDRVPHGVFRDLHVPVGLEIEWRPTPCVSVALSGGANVRNWVRFDDRRGHKVVDTDVDPAGWLGLSVAIRF